MPLPFSLPLPLCRTVLSGLARRSTLRTMSTADSKTSIAPSFYRTSPPPHWSSANPAKRKFRSPWPSSASHGAIQFIRARLFDWDEPPLPPKVASTNGGATLPPVIKPDWGLTNKSDSDLSVTFTWLGHASVHLRIPLGQGKFTTILCDPVLSRRCSPFQWLGPERYTDSPTTVAEIADAGVWPQALVLSHNHYDHLDHTTVSQLLNPPSTSLKRPHVFCTLGNKAWFQSNFSLRDDEITECDWWEQATFAGLTFTCVPAQHFSGRGLFDRDRSHWAGWTFRSTEANVYFAGDTGYRSVPRGLPASEEDTLPACPAFKEIGEQLGPFDVSLIPIGAYLPRYVMSPVHLNPADSVRVHRDVKSRKSYGIHWGSFRLTPEDVNQPPELLRNEAASLGLGQDEFTTLRIGESVSVSPQTNVPEGAATASTEALPESRLGTKAHWDSVYEREVRTYNEVGEEGEVWFGEDALMRMTNFLEDHVDPSSTVLDLGTGNGHLLFELCALDFEPANMLGIDYSPGSIDLAKAVGQGRGDGCENVPFQQADLLDDAQVSRLAETPWDVVCDKGTMDAIALSSQPIDGKLPLTKYTEAVAKLTKKDGIFLITSCNFTQQEVTDRFVNAGE